MKVLNLYAGLGGNRKNWPDYCKVTALETNEKIAAEYARVFPSDQILLEDAHEYLLRHYSEFDFIWSSPPCPTHSRASFHARGTDGTYRKAYPDMSLYQEVLFLKHYFKGRWVVENVIPFYAPLIPANKVSRHLFWSEFFIPDITIVPAGGIEGLTYDQLCEWIGLRPAEKIYNIFRHPEQVIRNCVHPVLGRHVFDCVIRGDVRVKLLDF
jgi:DNA (cytosine-5)-methyltransferase 1